MDWPLIKKEEPVDFIFEYESIDFESKNDFQMLADKIKEKRTTEYDSYESGSIDAIKQEPDYGETAENNGTDFGHDLEIKYEITEVNEENQEVNDDEELNLATSEDTSHPPSLQENSYQCDKCSMIIKSRRNFISHFKRHSRSLMDRCTICQKLFKKSNMAFHIRVHSGLKPYFCTICPKTFWRRSNLSVHIMTHQEPSFKCNACDKLFIHKKRLDEHMQVHWKRERLFQCEYCPRRYIRYSTLNRHLRRSHPDIPQEQYICSSCNKVFSSVRNFNRHICGKRTAIVECPHCYESFSGKVWMKRHFKEMHISQPKAEPLKKKPDEDVPTHKHFLRYESKNRDNPYFECYICSSVFSTKEMLIVHFGNYHKILGLEKYQCFLCSDVFANRKSLNDHVFLKNHSSFKLMPVMKSYSHKR